MASSTAGIEPEIGTWSQGEMAYPTMCSWVRYTASRYLPLLILLRKKCWH